MARGIGDDREAMRGLAAGLMLALLVMPIGRDAFAGDRFRLLQLGGHPVKWGSPARGAGASIGYAFVDRKIHFDNARNCRDLEPLDATLATSGIGWSALRPEVEAAFAQWASVANVNFHETAAARAQIFIGAFSGRGAAFADVAWQRPVDGETASIERSLICLNADRPWKLGFDGDLSVYDVRYTLTHEIGHAIGLDHPGTFGALMSFPYNERFRTLRDGDIKGVVALYGARPLPVAGLPVPVLGTAASVAEALPVAAPARKRPFP